MTKNRISEVFLPNYDAMGARWANVDCFGIPSVWTSTPCGYDIGDGQHGLSRNLWPFEVREFFVGKVSYLGDRRTSEILVKQMRDMGFTVYTGYFEVYVLDTAPKGMTFLEAKHRVACLESYQYAELVEARLEVLQMQGLSWDEFDELMQELNWKLSRY